MSLLGTYELSTLTLLNLKTQGNKSSTLRRIPIRESVPKLSTKVSRKSSCKKLPKAHKGKVPKFRFLSKKLKLLNKFARFRPPKIDFRTIEVSKSVQLTPTKESVHLDKLLVRKVIDIFRFIPRVFKLNYIMWIKFDHS